MSRRRHRPLRSFGLLATLTVLAGCWGQVGFDAANSRNNSLEHDLTPANVGSLAPTWSVPSNGNAFFAEPIVPGDGRIYTLRNKLLEARNSATGALLWSRILTDAPGVNDLPSVVNVGGELWVSWEAIVPPDSGRPGECHGAVERIDPSDGSLVGTVWPDGGGELVPAGPQVVTDVRHLESACGGLGFLEVRDPGSGAPVWASAEARTAGKLLPVVVGDRIFRVNNLEVIAAYNIAGCGAATCPALGFLDLRNDYDLIFHVAGGAGELFGTFRKPDPSGATAGTSDLVAIDPETLEVLWRAPLANRDGLLAVTADTVFVVGPNPSGSTLEAFSADGCGGPTCSPAWSAPIGNVCREPTLAVGGDVVYTGSAGPAAVGCPLAGSQVVAFDARGCSAATCAPLARVAIDAPPDDIIVAGGRLFVVDNERQALASFAPA
jgi:hypothetical protein